MKLNEDMITEKDIDELENRFKKVFATKEDLMEVKSDLINKLDSILKEILAMREDLSKFLTFSSLST